jgi:hypothetical protein
VRVCARGRDQAARHAYDDPPPDPPLEHHAVLVWPAPSADPVVHKATDQIGATLRGEPDAEGVTPPPLAATEAAHQALRAIAGELDAARPAVADELTSVQVEVRVAGHRPVDVFRYVRFPINWLAHGGRPAEAPGEEFRSWIAPANRLDARGELLAVRPNRTVVFSWQFIRSVIPGSTEVGVAMPDPPMTVTTVVRRSGDDTVIAVSTEGVPVDWIDRVRALWLYHLSCVRIFSGGGFPGNPPWWHNP